MNVLSGMPVNREESFTELREAQSRAAFFKYIEEMQEEEKI